jgi:hypothetical protein
LTEIEMASEVGFCTVPTAIDEYWSCPNPTAPTVTLPSSALSDSDSDSSGDADPVTRESSAEFVSETRAAAA